MEKQYQVIVNHNGSCGGYHYKMGEKVILPESVVIALGSDAGILQEVTPHAEEVPQEPEKPAEKPAVTKAIKKAPKDKMVKTDSVINK